MTMSRVPKARAVRVAAAVTIVGVVVWLRLPGLFAGYALDDYAHLAMLSGEYPLERGWWDLFNFVDGTPGEVSALQAFGSLPWWADPNLRLAALRPLASLLTAIDVWLFGHNPVVAHLHSLAWLFALFAAYLTCIRKFLPAASMGLALFALDESLTLPLAWLANRNALVCGLLVLVSVSLYVSGREREMIRGKNRWSLWSTFSLGLALFCGEQAVCGILCICMYEWLGRAPGTRSFRGLIAPALVTAAYVSAHVALGYGARNTGGYLDPFGETMAFVAAAPGRFCSLLGEVVFAVPALASEGAGWVFPMGLLALSLMAAIAFVLPSDLRRHAKWLSASSCMCILPALASPPSSRLLVLASLWWSCVLGVLLHRLWRACVHRKQGHAGVWVVAGVLLGIHAVVAPMWARSEGKGFVASSTGLQRGASEAALADSRRVIVVRTHDIASMLYVARARHEGGVDLPDAWWTLSAAPGPHTLIVHRPTQLELHIPRGLLSSPTARFFRRQPNLRVGEQIELGEGVRVEILEIGWWGPTRVGITCTPEVCNQIQWLQIIAGTIKSVPPPREGLVLPLPVPTAVGSES